MNLLQDLPQPQIRRRRVSVDDYHRMAEVGLLAPEERVELVDGEIIDMAPMGSRHHSTVLRLSQRLHEAAAPSAQVSTQLPVRLAQHSEPEPDLALLRPRADFYAQALPSGTDCLLVIEVSDTTLAYDVRVKLPLYALHGVPEVWIVDLVHEQLHRHAEPAEGRYTLQQSLPAPAGLALPGTAGASVSFEGVWSAQDDAAPGV